MEIAMYQVDAFADSLFRGNPAAVCILEDWLPTDTMLAIAGENNLAETAFFIPREGYYDLKWFTPEVEIDLCGHATLATSHVIIAEEKMSDGPLRFQTRSGELTVEKIGELYQLNFPSRPPEETDVPDIIRNGIGGNPEKVLKARDYFFVYNSEEEIHAIRPDQRLLATINDAFAGIIITAPGNEVDFVSRFFTPGASVFEDPVTGSAHSTLIPYWSEILGKKDMVARQVSPRGGQVECSSHGDRVHIRGTAVTYLKGRIKI